MNFLGVGVGELLLILVIATIVVGPERMVQLSGQMGRFLAKFREQTEGVTREFKEAFDLELGDVLKDTDEGASAATTPVAAGLPSGNGAAPADGAVLGATDADTAAAIAAAAAAAAGAEPGPSAEEVAIFEAVQLEQRLASDMVDGELEVTLEGAASGADGDGLEDDMESYEDVAPIEMQLATIVPEDQDVEPTAVNDVLIIGDDEPAAELPVEAEE